MNLRPRRPALKLAAALAVISSVTLALAQDNPKGRGRKYKPPPETAHIEIFVTKGYNHKPISNAAVILHELAADGTDDGNLEIKTDPDGKATVPDVIPIGTKLRVQVLANGFATFADDYEIKEASRQIPIAMLRPQEQISTYQDNSGKASTAKPGVQEPIRPKPADAASKSVKIPASTTPPKAPPLPPSEQNTPSPVPNPPPPTAPNQ
jgi:hypothetical protein